MAPVVYFVNKADRNIVPFKSRSALFVSLFLERLRGEGVVSVRMCMYTFASVCAKTQTLVIDFVCAMEFVSSVANVYLCMCV